MTSKKKYPSMKAAVETISPQRAAQWLKDSTNYRKMSARRVERMAQLIQQGFWDVNGETIKFNGDGTLKDGQHRLAACVQADKSIKSVVVYGIPTDLHVDVGKARTFAEWLHAQGEKNCSQLASALRFVWDYKHDNFGAKSGRYAGGPSMRELIQLLAKHPQLRDSVSLRRCGRLLAPSLSGGLHYLFRRKSSGLADDFIDGVRGELIVEDRDDPVERLRIILLKDMRSRDHMTTRHKAALCIKAWNYWRAGTEVKSLRFIATGQSREPFPVIR